MDAMVGLSRWRHLGHGLDSNLRKFRRFFHDSLFGEARNKNSYPTEGVRFGISVICNRDNVPNNAIDGDDFDKRIIVLATNGDTHLGGDDFDKRIVDKLASDFKRDEGIDLRGDKQAMQRLTE
eukprot:8891554-Pyramimonas_sp.AAC.1